MTKEAALRYLIECRNAIRALDSAAAIAGNSADEDERRLLRRAIALMLQEVWDELVEPVLLQYPDLDPARTDCSLSFLPEKAG